MPEPVMLTVMKALTAEIERRADLPGCVFRGKSHFGPAMGGPEKMVSVFVDGTAAEDYPQQTHDGRARLVRLPLLLMGYDATPEALTAHPDHPTDPATIMADRVIRALRGIKADGAETGTRSRNLLGLGRIVDSFEIGTGYPYPEFANPDTTVPFFLVPVAITYADL